MDLKHNSNLIAPNLNPKNKVHFNLPYNQLIELAINHKEGVLGEKGEIICSSHKFKGRSPRDKFFVTSESGQDHIWWGDVNHRLSRSHFLTLHKNVTHFLGDKELYIFDGFAGANINHRLNVRIITTKAWHCHFVSNMFIKPHPCELVDFKPDFIILNACEYKEQDWRNLGLRSEVFITLNLDQKLALIGGTEYAGEMKKGIFSVMNYLLPLEGVMPMHCSATIGENKDVAIYFGLSGTGKTTLSADPNRTLIGDDEHGWSDEGVFNFEGGCYAKTYRLSKEQEPDIWNAIKFGALLENVKYDEFTRKVNYNNNSITENGRVSYPLDFIDNHEPSGMAGHPKYILMLTCDAFGVLPPIARLTPEQASYHFLSGYTAKVAGTEAGVTGSPKATFSTCFGAPFMTQKPIVYGNLLENKMKKYHTKAYLINTGWVGGTSGHRIELKYTRAIIDSIISGEVEETESILDGVFGFRIPTKLLHVPTDILIPQRSWSNINDYSQQYKKLAKMFVDNFQKEHIQSAKHLLSSGPNLELITA